MRQPVTWHTCRQKKTRATVFTRGWGASGVWVFIINRLLSIYAWAVWKVLMCARVKTRMHSCWAHSCLLTFLMVLSPKILQTLCHTMCYIGLVLLLATLQLFWSMGTWWHELWPYCWQLKIQPTSLFSLQHTLMQRDGYSVFAMGELLIYINYGLLTSIFLAWSCIFHGERVILWVNVSSWHAFESTVLSRAPCAKLRKARKHHYTSLCVCAC